jgi:hypothetical protein
MDEVSSPGDPQRKGSKAMRRILLLSLLLAGCQSPGREKPPVDQPRFNTGEQFRRSRDELAFPDQSNSLAPRTYAEIPNATGR